MCVCDVSECVCMCVCNVCHVSECVCMCVCMCVCDTCAHTSVNSCMRTRACMRGRACKEISTWGRVKAVAYMQ